MKASPLLANLSFHITVESSNFLTRSESPQQSTPAVDRRPTCLTHFVYPAVIFELLNRFFVYWLNSYLFDQIYKLETKIQKLRLGLLVLRQGSDCNFFLCLKTQETNVQSLRVHLYASLGIIPKTFCRAKYSGDPTNQIGLGFSPRTLRL
jgi:hypothetical protein